MNTDLLTLSLLYVEDDEDTREQLSEVFKNKVKNLYIAKDGLDALEIFKNNNIHLIISDYQMPNMNGTELCAEVKKIKPLVSFVLLTAYNDSKLLMSAIESGVDKFLQKPIDGEKLFSILEDAHEKVNSKFELEKSIACLREAEHIAQLSYWNVDLNSNTIKFSQEAIELFNLTEEKENITYKSFANIVVKEDIPKFIDIFEKQIYKEEIIDEVISINYANTRKKYIHIITNRWQSSICGSKHIIGLFQDVSHYEIQKHKLLKENKSDPMLKIANKKSLTSELNNLIVSSNRYGHPVGVVFFDIDDFKIINDNYGHLFADDILLQLSNLIKNNIRQSDIFGRWGGDEFVIITGYSSQESTIEFTKKLLTSIKDYSWPKKIKLTISFGLSFYENGDDSYTLIDRADSNMIKAKQSGKDKIYTNNG